MNKYTYRNYETNTKILVFAEDILSADKELESYNMDPKKFGVSIKFGVKEDQEEN